MERKGVGSGRPGRILLSQTRLNAHLLKGWDRSAPYISIGSSIAVSVVIVVVAVSVAVAASLVSVLVIVDHLKTYVRVCVCVCVYLCICADANACELIFGHERSCERAVNEATGRKGEGPGWSRLLITPSSMTQMINLCAHGQETQHH